MKGPYRGEREGEKTVQTCGLECRVPSVWGGGGIGGGVSGKLLIIGRVRNRGVEHRANRKGRCHIIWGNPGSRNAKPRKQLLHDTRFGKLSRGRSRESVKENV